MGPVHWQVPFNAPYSYFARGFWAFYYSAASIVLSALWTSFVLEAKQEEEEQVHTAAAATPPPRSRPWTRLTAAASAAADDVARVCLIKHGAKHAAEQTSQ